MSAMADTQDRSHRITTRPAPHLIATAVPDATPLLVRRHATHEKLALLSGVHHIIPIPAKAARGRIDLALTAQHVRFVERAYPDLRCRAVATQFVSSHTVAVLELAVWQDEIRVRDKRHLNSCPQMLSIPIRLPRAGRLTISRADWPRRQE